MIQRYEDSDMTALFDPEYEFSLRVEFWKTLMWIKGGEPMPMWFDPRLAYLEAAQLEARYGHDVAAQAEAVRNQLMPTQAKWVHWGCTSSDVVDVALQRQLLVASNLLGTTATQILQLLDTEPVDWYNRTATTHGQPAMPSSYQHLFATCADRLRSALHALRRTTHAFNFSNALNGPVGDPKHCLFTVTERREILSSYGLELAPTHAQGQAFARPALTRHLESLAALAEAAGHFALQLRLLAARKLAVEPAPRAATDYRGSSSMPHKSNPTRSERIGGLAPLVRAYAGAHAQVGAQWWDMHSLEHSSLERVVVPDAHHLTAFILRELHELVSEVVISTEEPVENTFAQKHALIEAGTAPEQAHQQVRAGLAKSVKREVDLSP